MVNGIENGRGGKGSVFVFASGNGGRNGDQCNFDGYTNSIFSVTVAAIDYKGLHPDYSEACAANMIVAYTSGSNNYIVRSAPAFFVTYRIKSTWFRPPPTEGRISALTRTAALPLRRLTPLEFSH